MWRWALAAGVCVAAWQASRVTRHEEIAPILTPLLAVLLVILISFARADRGHDEADRLYGRDRPTY